MDRNIKKMINTLTKLYKQNSMLNRALPRLWYGTNHHVGATSENEITSILRERFPNAKKIQVEDVSGGCGAMYNIYVETKEFKDLSIVKQHQAIYATLNEQIKQIHGVHVVTKAAA